MSDLVKRLRDPWPEVDYSDEAADKIEQLERELAEVRADHDEWMAAIEQANKNGQQYDALERQVEEWRASQTYRYIGVDGKPVLARDLEDRAIKAEGELARAKEEIAQWRKNYGDLGMRLEMEKSSISYDWEYQGYSAVDVNGELYVHKMAYDDAWSYYKEEKALADRLYVRWMSDGGLDFNPVAQDYRKARGL